MELMDSSFFDGGRINKKGHKIGYLMQVFKLPDGTFQGRIMKAAILWEKGNMAEFQELREVLPLHSCPYEDIQDARYWAALRSESRIKRWKKNHPDQ